MQPKVTIILPVYNVERYLRQCLYSVVNQTMQDIQIICVNDGSTDGSPAILEEYAAKDPRIEIIHQENQGGGSARNAAYPYIRGKYAYFVDPDDWLDLDLCQQCYDKAEETGADCVRLRHTTHAPEPTVSPPYDPALPEVRRSPEEKYELLRNTFSWRGFWRSEFLLSKEVRFSEGKRPYNDMLFSWKGTVLANRVAILDSPLYHYRIRSDSYQRITGEKHFIVVETCNDIRMMLQETGLYGFYKNRFLDVNLSICFQCYYYRLFSSKLRSKFREHIRRYRTEDERDFYRNDPENRVPKIVRLFHTMIDGGPVETVNYYVSLFFFVVAKAVKMPKRFLLQKITKRIKERLMELKKK